MRLKLSQQAAILIAVPLMFEIAFVLVLTYLLRAAEAEAATQLRAKTIVADCTQLDSLYQDSGIILYIYNFSHSHEFERKLGEKMESIPRLVNELERLSTDDPNPGTHLAWVHLHNSAMKATMVMRNFYKSIKENSDDINAAHSDDIRKKTIRAANELVGSVRELTETQIRVEAQSGGVAGELRKYIQVVLIGGVALNVALAVALAQLFYRGTMQRMSTLMENSSRLGHGQELMPMLGGHDELGDLDRVFHGMAASLREAQRKERAVIDYALDVICSLDGKFVFRAVNPAARNVLGYHPDELVGSSAMSLAMMGEQEEIEDKLSAIAGGAPPDSFESRLLRKDGTIVDVLWSAFWSKSEQSMFCVLHNISDRKEVERLKQEFVQMISHDLRTPLMSVQADLSLLAAGASGDLPDRAKKNVADAEQNVEYVISLINSLLDIERMTSGKLDLDLQRLPLNEIVKRAVEAVQALAQRKKLHIDINFGDDFEVFADETRLLQVVVNLLSNAVKYSSAEDAIVLTTVDAADSVEVRIRDHGRGIPHEQQEKIFERFHQVSVEDATVRGGSGLGLAICKAIIQAHDGKIGVESEVGSGSEFWFRIPKALALDPVG